VETEQRSHISLFLPSGEPGLGSAFVENGVIYIEKRKAAGSSLWKWPNGEDSPFSATATYLPALAIAMRT